MKIKLKKGQDFLFDGNKIDLFKTNVKNILLIVNYKTIPLLADGYRLELESVYLKLSIFQYIKWYVFRNGKVIWR